VITLRLTTPERNQGRPGAALSETKDIREDAGRFHLIYAASLLTLAMAASLILGRASAYAPETKPSPAAQPPASGEQATLHMAARNAMGINLAEGRGSLTTYLGEPAITQLLERNLTRPLALASADFDEDGVPDLLGGYAGAGKGLLTLHRGNVDLIFPNSPQSKNHDGGAPVTEDQGGAIDRSVPAYFLAAACAFDLPEPADFLGAGDFDADGHWDVVAAARGGNKLYWLPGDGRGGFQEARAVELQGGVTALIAGDVDRADGLTDIVVATAAQDGAKVLVFESPEGALKGDPDAFAMPAEATGLALEGNFIGTDVTGAGSLGNTFYGVLIDVAATGNFIGGTLPGAGNTIAFNGGPGLSSSTSLSNAIRGNSIFSNGGLGIELGASGVNANEPCDGDANNLQNFPVITSVRPAENGTLIEGTLDSRPGSQFAIDCFANHSCDFLGNGEGETYIGSITVTTNAGCTASFRRRANRWRIVIIDLPRAPN
jgi:hypothetical protein